ncbi:MAG: DUF2530 domain-containing protein [Propionicimonas sp.]
MPQTHHHHKPLMVQAPVRALDPDGTAVISGGTAGFAIGSLACWLGWDDLVARDDAWYLGVSLTGLGLGIVGALFSWTRAHQRRQRLIPLEPDESVE